jgi:hypothetical protein
MVMRLITRNIGSEEIQECSGEHAGRGVAHDRPAIRTNSRVSRSIWTIVRYKSGGDDTVEESSNKRERDESERLHHK